MYTKKATLSLTVVFVVLIAFSLLFTTIDLRNSSFLPLPRRLPPCIAASSPPLRVYMYDLPRRFNVGMFRRKPRSKGEDSPVTARDLPPWPRNSGLKRQHSVEYWMMASLLYGEGEGGREVVRVSDPEVADVYFVPFFSSLSFNTHGHNMTDPDTEIDRQLQVLVLNSYC
ncbi:hypothetical protein MLD38_017043 [Melastoma candidum]|uniref:Uncharacterized protein n=1 Tax=Melastoma candidum TaxID=119954 RepID=A0ACB9QNL4_9MYRT|nr:hypothetical protein MLD38_017043 [Melastoma candidum]